MTTTKQSGLIEENQTSPIKQEKKSENNVSFYLRFKDTLRDSRINTLGVRYYPMQLAQEVWEHAIAEGEAQEKQKLADDSKHPQHKRKPSKAKPELNDDNKSKDSFFSKISAKSNRARIGISGSLILLEKSRKNFIDNSVDNGNRIKQERIAKINAANGVDTPIQPEKSKTSTDKGSNQRVLRLFDFRRGAFPTLFDRASTFVNELKACGKSEDLNRRQRAAENQIKRREAFESMLSQVGITSHKELQDLNKRLNDLINATSQFAHNSDTSTIQTLERRRQDRRVQTNDIDYEMRIYSRRGLDRRAA